VIGNPRVKRCDQLSSGFPGRRDSKNESEPNPFDVG
jgi:hypothetical protein